jgi:hypothetical protein
MKKVLSAIVIGAMVFGAGSVMADSFTAGTAGNIQTQVQNLGGANYGANGGISVINQDQAGLGGSAAMIGSYGAEGQIQGENTNVSLDNGFANHNYNATAVTEGSSATLGGVAGHYELQNVDGGIATVGDANGTNSISGSAMDINQNVGSAALGYSGAEAGAFADYHSDYKYSNVGANSTIVQTGSQDAVMVSGSGSEYAGASYATLEASQVGATAATNDGNGTSMSGVGSATGTITTKNDAVGYAGAGSAGVQGQTHSYSQVADNGAGQTQFATGTVSTGNAVVDGTVTP